ncbi:MAG: hypothetical protein Fues2KO_45310 [Fuerstiella sp.]
MNQPTSAQPDPQPQPAPEVPQIRLSFTEVAKGQTEIIIEHEGQDYRLRATRNGKLLLNK